MTEQQNGQRDPLERIAVALETIAFYMTPVEERGAKPGEDDAETRRYVIDGYIRFNNKGGEGVILFSPNPKLIYSVVRVYAEDFDKLTPYFDPTVGQSIKGGVATREQAEDLGILQVVKPFVAYVGPSGRVVKDGLHKGASIKELKSCEPLNENGNGQPRAGTDSRQPEPPRDARAGTDGRLALMQEFGLTEARFSELMVSMKLPYNTANHDAIRARLQLMRGWRKLQQDTGFDHRTLTTLRKEHNLGEYSPAVDAQLRALIKGLS